MAAGTAAPDREEIRRRLREDYEFAIETAGAAKIVTKAGETVTMRLKRPQRRLLRLLAAQRDAGEPMRAQLLKSRQVGMSTLAQVVGIIRTSQTPNHVAITVAQDRDTVSSLFDKGFFAYSHLPAQIKPPAAYAGGTKERRYLTFGEPSPQQRRAGVLGLNSSYETATANRASAGRGRTIHTLHLSEPAFWDDYGIMLGIVQGVPDLPGTLILKESTANGNNEFKDEWDDAVAGTSGYIAFFSPWFEEDEYRRKFPNELERSEFKASLGTGRTKREMEAAEEEPDLYRQISTDLAAWALEDGEPLSSAELELRVLEHLHWRRWAIGAKTQGDLEKFHQEYPSTPAEAFMATGRRVFKPKDLRAVLEAVEVTDPATPTLENTGPARGVLRPTEVRPVRSRRNVTIDVPGGAEWVPRSRKAEDEVARWLFWQLPVQESMADYAGEELELGQQIIGQQVWTPAGQYMIGVDTASGEEDDAGAVHANHAITVIDHRSLSLVAMYESQSDPDDLAEEVLLAALFWNRAWVVVEATGGWGLPVLRRLTMDYHYPFVYTRAGLKGRTDDMSDTLGFSTDPSTRPLIVARGIELVRDLPRIVVSRLLASQMETFIYDKKGKPVPEPGKLSDVLMSWLIVQYVATLRPIRLDKPGKTRAPRQMDRGRVAGAAKKRARRS